MRFEYTNEQEKQLRIAEIEAILTNELTEQCIRKLALETELQFLQGNTNDFGEQRADIILDSGEMIEIIFDEEMEKYSMLIFNEEGNPMLPYYNADTVEELLEEVCEY